MGRGWGEAIVSNNGIYTESSYIVLLQTRGEVRVMICVCAIVSTLVHVCEGEVVSYICVMWYISVRHPENTPSPAVTASFCCHSPFALGSFDAFLIPVVTMEMQGVFFFCLRQCERQVHGGDPR